MFRGTLVKLAKNHLARFVSIPIVLAITGLQALSPSAHAQVLTTIYNFCSQGDCTDGKVPTGGLLQDTDGYLWGTTSGGGANKAGTVFKITPSGTLTTIYNFCSQGECADGAEPSTSLMQDSDGDLYGITVLGGAYDSAHPHANSGTVFKISATGFTSVGSFCLLTGCTGGAAPSTGSIPSGPLVQAPNGNLYGVTTSGGLYAYPTEYREFNGGTIFKITSTGALTTLYSFCAKSACMDGEGPTALMLANDGNLYGTTWSGGDYSAGTVFKVTPSGAVTTLYSFCALSDCPDGSYPNSLVQGADGDLYGTTDDGGAGCGTIFKITTGGALTQLRSFQSGDNECYPSSALVQATDGNFYGTTREGGPYFAGSVFKITPSGELKALAYFCGVNGECVPGVSPGGWPIGLIQATNGDFYGVTELYGGAGQGTAYQLSVGLGPFVKTLPTFGGVGRAVTIFGTDLAGASGVTFNGTAATFKVVSASAITATVPAGATSGQVKVTTPNGTLSSNPAFRVTQ
jgi:uncharacterized repeat protein (TIGR03803 family)